MATARWDHDARTLIEANKDRLFLIGPYLDPTTGGLASHRAERRLEQIDFESGIVILEDTPTSEARVTHTFHADHCPYCGGHHHWKEHCPNCGAPTGD